MASWVVFFALLAYLERDRAAGDPIPMIQTAVGVAVTLAIAIAFAGLATRRRWGVLASGLASGGGLSWLLAGPFVVSSTSTGVWAAETVATIALVALNWTAWRRT